VGSVATLVVVRNRRICWVAFNAVGAWAAVVRPSVRVLRDSDPALRIAIAAGIHPHIREASCSLKRAAIGDLGDPGDVIELEVPLLVESCITHRWRRRQAGDALRHLVVNVEVFSATFFLLSGGTTTMFRENLGSIDITVEVTISKEELARLSTMGMAVNHHILRDAHNGRPGTIMVNLKADGVAVLVVCLAGVTDASLTTALGEELFLGVIMEENVNVAFDFLGS
jgi:hypothetical protein